ncbi:vesicle-associated protein 2-1-like [Zingiber officinale]|uniref:vesicle-associated protein 2-1-like n=1 Tax=Zingiber officinale TaxID=94328 RepID=UPI001C4A7BA2|nr:vesicle-associated protein 2-1-like [Zingiber officinale]
MRVGGQMISVYPEELSFEVELEKPSPCNIKVVNNTEHHVAFKVKTTSPKKYFVRPNASVVQPWDSCTVTVTLQAQKELPPDMQCKDKFLIQSAKVPPTNDIDEIPKDTFNKDGEKVIEELKLRVVYNPPSQNGYENLEEESGLTSYKSRASNVLKNSSSDEALQQLKEERDFIVHQNHQFKRELEMLNKRRSRKTDAGFSMTFAAFAGLVGITFGFILNLLFTASPTS